MKKDLKKELKKLVDLKNKYDRQCSDLKKKINKMSIKDINKFLMEFTCPCYPNEDSYFQIEEGEEKNSNCTWDTYYKFNCFNCKHKNCYYTWKNKIRYCKDSVVEFLIEMLDK